METVDKQSLDARTRQRAALTWLALDYGGIMAPLASLGRDLNALAKSGIENFMTISDETWGIKEAQRDRTIALSQAEIDQEAELAAAKVAAGRAKIAIERAVDEYTLAVKIYDAQVKSQLMGAKEFAGVVEQEQLAAEGVRASVAVEKEGIRQEKLASEIRMEAINQAQVAADLAKARVEVAKAHVRAAIAGIEAGKAEVAVIEAQVEQAMAESEKATLQADVATIFAEIVTKQLSEVKLGVGAAEIVAGYTYIQSKLSDAVALYNARSLIEGIRTAAEGVVLGEIAAYQAAKREEQALREAEANVAAAVTAYEAGATMNNIAAETGLRLALVAARNALADARMAQGIGRDDAQSFAQNMINNAHKTTYKLSTSDTMSLTHETEYISGE
jgi:hypothetical protein